MKTVLVLIVLLLAGIAGLLYIKFSQETVTWDMDPTRMIVPLDKMAELAVAGEEARTSFDLLYRSSQIARDLDDDWVDFNNYQLMGANFDPVVITRLINYANLYFSVCFIDETSRDIAADRVDCDLDVADAHALDVLEGAQYLARATWLEADGWNQDDVIELYLTAGSKIGSTLAGGAMTYDDPDRRQVAALAKDFGSARALRLLLMRDGLDAELPPFDTINQWCRSDWDEICPGGLSTYNAIKLYLTGHHGDARTTALVALEGSQPWVYRAPYEHPLLWVLAASQHQGIDEDISDLQPLIEAALIEWPEDARTALLAYVDPEAHRDAGALPEACDTPGCRFFLAQFLSANGDTAAADAATEAGLDLCEGVTSIPCMALRLTGPQEIAWPDDLETDLVVLSPTHDLLPLDHPAALRGDDDITGALADVRRRIHRLRGIVEAAGGSFENLGGYRDWEQADTVILAINADILLAFECLAETEFGRVIAGTALCDGTGGGAFDEPIEQGLQGLARAFLLETRSRRPNEAADFFIESGERAAAGIVGEDAGSSDPERRQVAARLLDFANARAVRLGIVWNDHSRPTAPVDVHNPWCLAERNEVCPGGVQTYRSIDAYLQGDDNRAVAAGMTALQGAQPWVSDSAFEHPLLWVLAATRRLGGDVEMPDDLAGVIDAARDTWPSDALVALELFALTKPPFDPGDDLPMVCVTAGCRYFVAQYHYAAGDTAAGDAAVEAGLDLCRAVRSIPCTALRLAGAEADMAMSP
ncbi:MAG: hypothetical protein AAF563_00630 [Pseudomonadota bacterium]